MTLYESALKKFPWLEDFQRGWDTIPSQETLEAASLDLRVLFFGDGPSAVLLLSWLKPEKMSLPAYDCLLAAADIAGVRLSQWWRDRDRVEEILGARVRHVG